MNVNNSTGDFYRNRSIGANGPSTLAAAVSDLNQQQRLLGGPSAAASHFSLSDRIAALAAGGGAVPVAQHNTDGGAAAAAAALSSLGKIGGGAGDLGGTHGLLGKSALLSDGKFTKPVYDLQGHPKKIHDAAAIAAVYPPIVKPTVDIATGETETFAEAASSGLDSDELKRQQRLEQNKMSARRSRKRKKIIVEELQTTIDQLTAENEQLEEENRRLEEELERRKKAAAEKGGAGPGSTATSPSTVPPSFGRGISAGTCSMTTVPPTYTDPIGVAAPSGNPSHLVSQLTTIMNGQAASGLHPQITSGASIVAGPGLAATATTSIDSSVATPAPRPSQLYLSRPTANANTSASQTNAAQEQLHRSILSMYQEQERKNANKNMRTV